MSIRRRIKVEQRDRKDVLAEAVVSQEQFLEKYLSRPQRYQWLFGAGCSASAGIPLSKQIIDEIIVKVFEKTNPAKRGQVTAEELKEWVSREKWFNPNFAYISALEKEYPSAYLRTELFKKYMKGRFPAPGQLMHAIGVKENKLANRSYTTNWDTLTEDAFYWLRGTNCVTVKGPDQLREVKDTEHRFVVKLHGDYDRYDVRYLREGMARHNDDIRDFLRQSLANTGLVILGYAGMEYSVMNMLMEIVHEDPEVLNGGLFWGYMGNMKMIPETITDLMAIGLDRGKEFRIFESEESDFLWEKISRALGFTSIEEELSVAFFRFNKMPYGNLRPRQERMLPRLADLAHRDLLDEGFLVKDYNLIHEVWKQDTKGFMKKKEEKERAAREAERKLVNHCFNDLKHQNYADAEIKLRDVLTHFPDNEMVHWGLGWAHYATGRYQEALGLFDEALRRNDKNWATYVAKALCCQQIGQYRAEVDLYGRALEINGGIDFAWYNRGLAAHNMGEAAAEKECYETALSGSAGNASAWYNLGICYAEEGSVLSALRCFQRARDISPKFFNAYYNAGILLGKMGQDMQAIQQFDACININQHDDEPFKARGIAECMTSQYRQAIDSYEEYLHAHSGDAEAWNNYALALRDVGRLEEAMEYINRYLEEFPRDARVWFNKGLVQYDMGDKKGAMESWDKSLSINGDFDMVWYRKALLLGEIGQYEGEIEFLTKFLNRNSQDFRGWFELGEANRKLGDAAADSAVQARYYSAAVTAYDRALDIQRTDTPAWLMKTVCLNNLHRYEEALECVKFLERYDKNNAEVYYQKGLAQDGLGDQLGTVDTLAKVLKLDDNHEGAYFRRGLLLAELEQYAKAVDHFENVVRLNPERWQAYHFEGVCVFKQKDYDRALDIFKAAHSRFPAKARFLVDQALVFVMKRDQSQARKMLQDAVSMEPDLRQELASTPEFAGLV